MKKNIVAIIAVVVAIAASAFTTQTHKLAEGDYRFYSISGGSSSDPANYRYRTNQNLCSEDETVCSEVWNIGTETPSDGDLASDFAVHVKVGQSALGDYTGN